jgi:hypothetical protein
MIVQLNSNDCDKNETLNDGTSRLTYYFKNPIVLTEEYDLIINNFNLKKTINSSILVYDSGLSTVNNISSTREILPEFYNTNVIENNYYNITLYEWDGSSFVATNARTTVATTQTTPDLTTGQINITNITDAGSGFVLNNFLYVDKNDIISNENSYTNRYGEIKITNIVDDDIVKTLSNYADRNINPATSSPINERSYNNVFLYEDDGAGWYIDSGVRVNVEVAYPYAGATFANINITSLTNGGTNIALNQILYLDKFFIIQNEPTMTYTVRFAQYQATEMINGVGSVVLSANVEILANEVESDFVSGIVYENITVYIANPDVFGKLPTDARANVTVLGNPTGNNGNANILSFSVPGLGFKTGNSIFIDKEDLVQTYNRYDPSTRYAEYVITTVIDDDDLTIDFSGSNNFGYDQYGIIDVPDGLYYYDVPNKNTRIYIEVTSPPSVSRHARLNRVEGTREGFVVGEIITLTRNDVISVSTGQRWSKQLSSGDLKAKVISLTATTFSSYNYEIFLENILYNNTKYFNSTSDSKALILRTDILNKNINNNNPILCLTKQIIQEIKIIINRIIDSTDNFNLSICLKKNNY